MFNILKGPSSVEGPGHDERVGCKTCGGGGAQGGGIGAGGGGAATGLGGV